MERTRAVAPEHRPERPVFLYDGDCAFCGRWVRRWREITGDRVDYPTSAEAAKRFPEIGPDDHAWRAWLVLPDGRAFGGARAVFGLAEIAGSRRWPVWCYDEVPPFAAASEAAYDLIASHRGTADVVTKILWGPEPRRPRYHRVRSWLIRAIGLVYAIAFASLGVQVTGLIGSGGILPAAEYLDGAREVLGPSAYRALPTAFWLNDSDAALRLACWGGVVGGLLVAIGLLPRALLALLWVRYLSLTVVGQVFLGYQWDALLLESGLLAVLLAPGGGWLGKATGGPPRLVVWLFRWLVFRLMFLSGVVKLTSGDPLWRAWRAMEVHYQTQPIPAWTSWWMHHLPPRFHTMSVGFMFWAELVVPFLVFGPRRVRWVAVAGIVGLQAMIAATGNYGFFNLLSIVLCLAVLEDRDLGRMHDAAEPPRPGAIGRRVRAALGVVIVLVTTLEALDRCGVALDAPGPIVAIRDAAAPLRSFNAYGLFAVMTPDRPEITVEGSDDGVDWRPYRFRWKPGPVGRRPRFCTPHMPRLDWQLWFAALAPDCGSQPWFLAFEVRLLEGAPDVLALLDDDPFEGRPPRFVRSRVDLYEFSPPGSADWWVRDPVGLYCPPIGLPDEEADGP